MELPAFSFGEASERLQEPMNQHCISGTCTKGVQESILGSIGFFNNPNRNGSLYILVSLTRILLRFYRTLNDRGL
jgi:hypothetical protein